MQLTDTREIRAQPEVVWAAILDPGVLKECIPGCERLTGSAAEGFEAVVKQKVGPVSATFTGLVHLSDIVEGRSLKISGEGKGGVAGFAKGGATVRFEAAAGVTRLTYEAEASVGGKIAQLGSRIIDSFARKLADEFFTRFQAAVEGAGGGAGGGGGGVDVPDAAVSQAGEEKKGWFKRLLG